MITNNDENTSAAGDDNDISNEFNRINNLEQNQFDKNNSVSQKSGSADVISPITSEELLNKLKRYNYLQDKYHTVLLMPKQSTTEPTAGLRNGAAYALRCFKMRYELPSDVLFSAMSLVDRYLERNTIKPKHVIPMSVAAFHLAIKQLNLPEIPAEDLVTISQCSSSTKDIERMSNTIRLNFKVQLGFPPITSLSFLRIYYELFYNLARETGGDTFEFFKQFIEFDELETRLEFLLCDVKSSVVSPSTLGLVTISLHIAFHIKQSVKNEKRVSELKVLFDYILFLQNFLKISDRIFECGFVVVSGLVSYYNGETKKPYKHRSISNVPTKRAICFFLPHRKRYLSKLPTIQEDNVFDCGFSVFPRNISHFKSKNKQPYNQRFIWKISKRTMRNLRPTKQFSSILPTIEEGSSIPDCSNHQ